MPSTRSHKRKLKPVVSYIAHKHTNRYGREWWHVLCPDDPDNVLAFVKSEAWATRIAQALTDEEEFV